MSPLQTRVLTKLITARPSISRIPLVLAHGRNESGVSYMVTEPVGTHLDRSSSAEAVVRVIFDVSKTIVNNLAKEPHVLHRDVSATNIIMDPEGRGVLIDYQASCI